MAPRRGHRWGKGYVLRATGMLLQVVLEHESGGAPERTERVLAVQYKVPMGNYREQIERG